MWTILESHDVHKAILKIPKDIVRKYEFWKNVVRFQGPEGLRRIKGFHDEALKGKRKGERSSRLSIKYRVIYEIEDKTAIVSALDLTAHDYRR